MSLRVASRLHALRSGARLQSSGRRALNTVSVTSHRSSSSSSNSHSQTRWNVNRTLLAGAVVGAVVLALNDDDEHRHVAHAKAAPSHSNTVDYNAVRQAIADILDKPGFDDGSLGPLFVRLAWHLSGTYDKTTGGGGSNGATMRFNPESNWGANAGLSIARDALEPIKKRFPQISYADLYTLAGVVSVEEMGGPDIKWRPGRKDYAEGQYKVNPDGLLPDAALAQDHVRQIFYRMGFNDREIVALLGAHSLGRCHTDRSGFLGPWTRAPTTVSNEFYRVLLEEKWVPKKWNGPRQFENVDGQDLMMTPADMTMVQDPSFRKFTELYARDEEAWRTDFAEAFSKLLELGVPYPSGSQPFKFGEPAEAQVAQPKKSLWSRIFG